eukprot:TRINITY_DN7283_c0_g1_i4.p2 TRINITY_DN7283_c0_g1~~TRINITY_DN7283_c0_g1_i4.p2  ORF type:complete len:345 (+),score=166.69 TRINITY_DN7283_c0_g1_i4:62-1096(+)
MYRTAALALLALATPAGAEDIKRADGHGHIDNLDLGISGDPLPPAYETTDVLYSVCMNCQDKSGAGNNCFMNGKGVFNRANYETHLLSALGKVHNEARKMYEDHKTEKWISYVDADAANFGGTKFSFDSGNLVWDRVWERTRPFEQKQALGVRLGGDNEAKYLDTVTDEPSWWNVCLRMNLTEVPTDVAELMPKVLAQLEVEYNNGEVRSAFDTVRVLTRSAWVEPLQTFVTNKLEPVRGLGHKDQRMLMPLILGVFSMLFVPILLTFLATNWAQGQKKFEDEHALQEKVIKYMEDKLAYKTAFADQMQSNVHRYAKMEKEAADAHNEKANRQYQDPDVDWTAQ